MPSNLAPASVTRYVATYINRAGMRTLCNSAQGRHTHATAAEAQAWIDAMRANNDPATLAQIFGAAPAFEVRAVACYPGHFDPMRVYFD